MLAFKSGTKKVELNLHGKSVSEVMEKRSEKFTRVSVGCIIFIGVKYGTYVSKHSDSSLLGWCTGILIILAGTYFLSLMEKKIEQDEDNSYWVILLGITFFVIFWFVIPSYLGMNNRIIER